MDRCFPFAQMDAYSVLLLLYETNLVKDERSDWLETLMLTSIKSRTF